MTPFVSILTPVHVAISLVGILTGFVVVFDMLSSSSLDGWTKIFLHSTLLTSLTGFLYPIHGITLGIILGILSLIVLAIAYPARYKFALAGHWRATYVITAIIALYFNCFVLVAQLYEKVPALHALAPMNSEPPFKFTQLAVLLLFFILGILSSIKFHPAKS
jgi:hypothetical protein